MWIWELQPGHDFECVAVLNGHAQDVKQVVWHPTEDVLVSVSYDDTVKVWTEDPGGDDWSCTVTVGAKEGGHESTVVGGVRSGDGSTDGDVFGRSNARRVGGERCVDSNAKARPRGDFSPPRLSLLLLLLDTLLSTSAASTAAAALVRRSSRTRSRCARVNINCQRDQIAGLAAPVGKIATVASLTCGRSRSASTIYAPNPQPHAAPDHPVLDPCARSVPPPSLPTHPSVSPALPHLRAGLPNMTVSPLFRFPSGHDRPTISVAWGACGVVAAGGGDNSLRCYAPAPNDPTQWRQIGAVEGAHEDDVNCVAWHPKETHSIATCSTTDR